MTWTHARGSCTQGDLNPQSEFFEFSQRLCIALDIVDRIMRMRCDPKLFPFGRFGGVPDEAGIQITNPTTGKSEWVFSDETVEVIIDKLPVEREVVRHKDWPTLCVLRQPSGESLQDCFRIVKTQVLFA